MPVLLRLQQNKQLSAEKKVFELFAQIDTGISRLNEQTLECCPSDHITTCIFIKASEEENSDVVVSQISMMMSTTFQIALLAIIVRILLHVKVWRDVIVDTWVRHSPRFLDADIAWR